MVKRATRKQRGVPRRKQKKIIMVGAEGKNQTERKYLESFNTKLSEYRIIISNGSHTDPEGVIHDLIKSANKEELDEEYGDLKVCFIDVDFPGERESKLLRTIELANINNVLLVFSNPCFEIWYLLHFRYSTKQYISNDEVINDLKKYIHNYTKSKDVFDLMYPNLNQALDNSRKLEKYHESNNVHERLEKNPFTEVYQFIHILLKDIN